MKARVLCGAALTIALGIAASADAATVNARQRHQRSRIREGVQSGELTRWEAARLSAQQRWIRYEEMRYRRNDGRLGPWERADLRRDLDRASRHIARQKHDRQDR
jgi:hypothetical protein